MKIEIKNAMINNNKNEIIRANKNITIDINSLKITKNNRFISLITKDDKIITVDMCHFSIYIY